MDSTTRRQLLAEIASLYYTERKTQSQIGKSFGYSRSAISRMISEAEETGIVEITIKHPIKREPSAERRLREKYNLEAAFVINPGNTSYQNTLQILGRAGAMFLEQLLKDNMTIGIGWGTSVSEVVKALNSMPLKNVRVVQVIGSVGGRSDPLVDGPGVASSLATRLNASYFILHSPVYLDSIEACKTLKMQKQIAETLKEGLNSDITLLGIGTVEIDPLFSSIFRSGFMDEQEIKTLRQQGGLVNFCGLILDQEGRILENEVNQRAMTVDLARLRANGSKMIGIAAGVKKSGAIEAVLKGNWLDVLITDSAAVQPILYQ